MLIRRLVVKLDPPSAQDISRFESVIFLVNFDLYPAADTLQQLGRCAEPELMRKISDPDSTELEWHLAAYTMGRIFGRAGAAIELQGLLKEGDATSNAPRIRRAIAYVAMAHCDLDDPVSMESRSESPTGR